MKILFINNSFWNFFNFRLNLISEIKKTVDSEIHLLAPYDNYFEKLDNQEDFICHKINFNSSSSNPISNFLLLLRFYLKIKSINPDLILTFTIKPNIYGSYISKILGKPIINNISGLGTVFIKKTLITNIVKALYKFAFKENNYIFFQNSYDLNEFKFNNFLTKSRYEVIPGSGIDTSKWNNHINNNKGKNILFCGRLIGDKGIKEYLNAAKILKKKYPHIIFNVMGQLGVDNKTSISKDLLEDFILEGIINYLGEHENIKSILENQDIVVLPSYREGMSRFLLESSSMKKPIITTNVPGCRDIVKDSYNGYLCEPKNSSDLADKSQRIKFGISGRKLMKEKFEEKIVIDRYIEIIKNI